MKIVTVRALAMAVLIAGAASAAAQDVPPSLRAAALPPNIVIDGRLSEPAWESAEAIEAFRQTDPVEGAPASTRTRVHVLADARSIVIWIEWDVADATAMVSFSVRRAAVPTSTVHAR